MQFVKGQSGNVKGRSKTTDRSLSEAVLKDRLKAYKFVQKAMKQRKPWAYELYFKALLLAVKEVVNHN